MEQSLGKRIMHCRKKQGLTQDKLAEMLGVTNKAVSKWERGESVPDLYVLKQLADFYGTSIDTLISDPMAKPKISKDKKRLRYVIAICATMLVWLVAVCVFSFVDIIIPTITHTWMTFIYALPITFIVLVVLTAVWKKKITTAVMVSALVWTVLLAVYLSLFHFLVAPPKTLWEIFLSGIPLQIIIVFWSIYKKNKN